MHRCLELALRGTGQVAPNPMVGAVLVHDDRIVGEGWHKRYGEAHAEVNCLDSVADADKELIPHSTLYVSLEPCAHFGKTPPCADLLIKHHIPNCVVGCRDPFEKVDGKGIDKLEKAGIEVIPGVLESECEQLNRRFFTFHKKRRPYIILKWAQTADGIIASGRSDRLMISNEYSNRLVHQWRSEEASILVGTNTALLDDPELTTRLWPGTSPVRIVIDMDLSLPASLKLFNGQTRTIVFNTIRHDENSEPRFYQVTNDVSVIPQLLNGLHSMEIQSVLVEGGARLLQSFIDEQTWDEARIITNSQLTAGTGLPAPRLLNAEKTGEIHLHHDRVETFRPFQK